MEWAQVFAIIVTLMGGIFYIHTDVRSIRTDVQMQGARIDKLYEMFVDLLKGQTKPTKKEKSGEK